MKKIVLAAMAALSFVGFADVTLETETFRLAVGDDAKVKSLVVSATGQDMVDAAEGRVPLFSVTQERPFNNEIKLMHPNKRTTFQANSLKLVEGRLRVGFETIPYGAFVSVKKGRGYLAFTLDGFDCKPEFQYEGLAMDTPPACEFRIAQLPLKERANFGDWLNVMWDEGGAVAVVGCDPYAAVDHEDRNGYRILYADIYCGMKLKGGSAAIVAGAGREAFLDEMEVFERDFGLPPGVKNRRAPTINRSLVWTWKINPSNVDQYIGYCKRSGITMLLIFYRAIVKGDCDVLGDYDLQDCYGGLDGVRAMLAKLKAAGITPGFHVLQTWIGARSRYVTPVLDPRLGKKRLFSLSKPIAADAAEVGDIYVEENPVDSPMHKGCRVLAFGGEAFSYEGYVTERPYRFTGVKRGHFATASAAHPRGEIGGVLDISEYSTDGIYIDQNTSLQDEVAEKIAAVANCGFEFFYLDGSEGVAPPCGINVSLAQMRVAEKLGTVPLFTEGAAKTHFGWHLQAGANAFDSFPPEFFKQTLVRFPMSEAPMLRKDFTRINFGWWTLTSPGDKVLDKFTSYPYREIESIGMQPDMWEFGTSRAAAWDCPITFNVKAEDVERHPRIADLFETIRRWEDVRVKGWLAPEQKEMLKSKTQEHHLYLNEKGEYELVPWTQIKVAGDELHHGLRAFVFERGGKRVVAYWHTSGCEKFRLADGKGTVVEASKMRYYETDDSVEAVTKAFAEAQPVVDESAHGPTETMFFFDAEDFTSDYANDAIRDLALLCTEEGVRAHFALVGCLGERFVHFGRKDVVEALKPHVVGTQSLYHSVHPNVLELSDRRDYGACYADVMGEEARGVGMLESALGRKMMCAVPPGNSKSYVAMYAYADLGIPFYCDTVARDERDGDLAYCNIRQIPYTYSFMPESLLPARSPQMPDLKPILDDLAKRRRIILFAHPNNALFSESWDELNYFRTNAVAWGEWKLPKRLPEAETAEYYARFRRLIRALKADGRFRFTDLEQIASKESPRVAIRRTDVPRVLAALRNDLAPLRNPSWSVADCFLAAVAFLRGETEYRPGKVYGFLEAPHGVSAPVTVSRTGLEAAARAMDVDGFLPTRIDVDGQALGPADFLLAALEVLATGAESVAVLPKEQLGDLSRFPALRDFRPAGRWVLAPEFKDEYASDRLRWQFWTLRYVDNKED